MSFYHLPHPWDPGYAIPRYVKAEPPERGTFTTAWMPRGTIPNLVPDYFANPMSKQILGRNNAGLSGLGSLGGSTLNGSTLKGSTLRGSTLAGSSLGANEYMLEPLGNGVDKAITKFGAKTAKQMIARIRQLPPTQRGQAMKAAMAQIEPSLASRCEQYALAAQKSGLPAPKAFELGLARALSEGLTGELARLGRSRELPQPSSLLGLGLDCARTRAQGAVGLGGLLTDIVGSLGIKIDTAGDRRPRQEGETGGGKGSSGDKLRGQNSPFEFTYAPTMSPPRPRMTGEVSMPTIRSAANIPAHWLGWLNQTLMAAPGQKGSEPAPMNAFWQAMGFQPGQPVRMDLVSESAILRGEEVPYFRATSPPVDRFEHEGSTWGVYIMMDVKRNPTMLGGYTQNVAFIEGGLAGAVKDVVKGVGSAVCTVVTNPATLQGATATASKTGNPYAAAAAGGVFIAGQVCGGMVAPPPPPPFFGSGSSLMPILLVGGGLLAVFALTREQ